MSILPSKPITQQRPQPFSFEREDLFEPQRVHMIVGRHPLTGADLRIAVTLDNMSLASEVEVISSGRRSRVAWLTDGIAGFFAYLRREIEVAGAAAELSRMDDRSLHDIGVDRGRIEHVVRHGGEFE